MKISVIVPIYNVEEYIEETIDSICNQNFVDYEIILINDGTKDNSVEIAENVIHKYGINYKIINQENKGLPSARNRGLIEAKGKYVCFIDSDDKLDKDFLCSQYRALERERLDVSFCKFEYTTVKNRDGNNVCEHPYKVLNKTQVLESFMKRSLKIHCCSLLINKQFLINNKLYFDENLRFGEDVEFMWRLFVKVERLIMIDAAYYKYLIRNNSIMTNQNINKIIMLNKIYSNTVNKISEEYPKYNYIFKYMPSRIKFACIHSYSKQSNYNSFKDLLNKLEYKKDIKILYSFPDFRVRILSRLLNYNKRLFYIVFRYI